MTIKTIMLQFLKDIVNYPLNPKDTTNKFHKLLQLVFKDYPAFLRTRPGWRRAVVFPFLILAKIFENKIDNKK